MPIFRVVALGLAKTFSKIFGLATITFFGRAPSRDDDKLGFAGLVSITWLMGPVAIVFPEVAKLIIPFLPEDDDVLRWVAIAVTVLLPPLVGFVISRVHNHPEGRMRALRTTLAGYLYTPAIGLLVVGLVVVVPIVKIGEIVRMRELSHFGVMVDENGFEDFCNHIKEILERNDVEVRDSKHAAPIRWLFAGLARCEGRIFCRDFSPRMVRLIAISDGEEVEVTLHSTDVSVLGEQVPARRVWTIIAEELDPRVAYFTWDDESQAVEDEIRSCLDRIDDGEACAREELDDIEEEMRHLALSAPEWNAIRRQLYRVGLESERLRVGEDA